MFQIGPLLDASGITYTTVQCLRLQRLVMDAVLEEIFKAITPKAWMTPEPQKQSEAIDMSVSEDDNDNPNDDNFNDDNSNDDNSNDDNRNKDNTDDDNSNDDNSNEGNPIDDNPIDDNPIDDNNDNDDVQGALALSTKMLQ